MGCLEPLAARSPNESRGCPPPGRWPTPLVNQPLTGTELHAVRTAARRLATRPGFSASPGTSTSSRPCDHAEDQINSPDTVFVQKTHLSTIPRVRGP